MLTDVCITNIGDHPSSSIFVYFSKTVEKSDSCMLTDVCMSRGTNRAQENADPMNKAIPARIYSGHNRKNMLKMYQTASYSTLQRGRNKIKKRMPKNAVILTQNTP